MKMGYISYSIGLTLILLILGALIASIVDLGYRKWDSFVNDTRMQPSKVGEFVVKQLSAYCGDSFVWYLLRSLYFGAAMICALSALVHDDNTEIFVFLKYLDLLLVPVGVVVLVAYIVRLYKRSRAQVNR